MKARAGLAWLLAACAAPAPPPPAPPPTTAATSSAAPPSAPTTSNAATPAPAATACEGPSLDLLAAIADPSCHVSEDEASALRDVLEDSARAPLRVEAERRSDGRVLVRIVNTGTAAQKLPLLVHMHLDNFSVTAEKRSLARPEPAWPSGFSFGTGRTPVKIGLPAGGKAEALLRIDETVVSHEVRNCPPNAKCAPAVVRHGRLPKGKHRLRIRTPLYSIRADLSAELDWVVE